jgi:hypothetical protein
MFPFCTTVPLLVGAEPSSDSVGGAPFSCSRSCIATPLVFEVSWASKVTTDIAWTSSGGARRVPFVAGGNVPFVVALEWCLLLPMSLSPFGTYRRSPENLENRFFARYSETCSFRETVPAWFVRFVRCLEVYAMLYDGCVGRSAAEVRGASRSSSNCQSNCSFSGLRVHILSRRMSA